MATVEHRVRSAVGMAKDAYNQAGTTAGQYGSTAGGIASNLIPFATRMMTNPTGESQRDIGAQLTNAEAGAGGATAGLTGAAGKAAGVTRNPMGFSSALDAAARERAKAAAATGENIAAKNADVKLNQQDQAARMLSGLYGTASGRQLQAEALQPEDVNAMANANKTGWFQNMTDLIRAIGQGAQGAGAMGAKI